MIRFVAVFVTLAVAQGMISPGFAEESGSRWIVPGQGIGKIALGPNGTQILKRFGKPDILDAGMSQTRQVWLGKGDRNATLFLHTTANGAIDAKPAEGITIDVVRTSSGSFHTASGISVGSTLAQVRHAFPQLRRDRSESGTVLYSDRRHGIAFDFIRDKANAPCVGITTFIPGHNHLPSNADVTQLIWANLAQPSP